MTSEKAPPPGPRAQLHDWAALLVLIFGTVLMFWRPSITGQVSTILMAIYMKICAIAARMDERASEQ